MEIEEIKKTDALNFIKRFHYSKVMPKLTKHCLGSFKDEKLIAVMTLGWGVRPKHTIKKLFPSLDTKDYYEIGKMCLDECMPKNSESQFISGCLAYIKKNWSTIKVLYTWSDGMLGKPGYVYQASNFKYGGFIWTDSYFKDGVKIHPRSTRELCKQDAKIQGKMNVFWLSDEFQRSSGYIRTKGKQFRYVRFLCSKKEEKRLLKESSIKWNLNFPKHKDLCWKTKNQEGVWYACDAPKYTSSINASEVSREIRLISNQKGLGQFQELALLSK